MTTSDTWRTGHLRYKDLCLDVADAGAAAAFWGPTLGLRVEAATGANRVLRGAEPEHTVWLNHVPEPKTIKNRVHLDVHAASVAELVDRGATVLGDRAGWTGVADPEGAELDVFVRSADALPPYRVYEVSVDAADPERIAAWWAERLGAEVRREDDQDFCWLEGGDGLPWPLVFAAVPEAKIVKNRAHLDLLGDTDAVIGQGATLFRSRDDGLNWDVLLDPEGNEFCVFAPT